MARGADDRYQLYSRSTGRRCIGRHDEIGSVASMTRDAKSASTLRLSQQFGTVLGRDRLHFFDECGLFVSLSFGGGVVRVATRTPTSTKNFSCPAGEQIQSMRTASLEAL